MSANPSNGTELTHRAGLADEFRAAPKNPSRAAPNDGMHAVQPAFIITVDTEGDNEWSRPNPILTRNAAHLPRFQALCEEFGFRPTWLTNYEMAKSMEFVRFGRDVIGRGAGEIGMHLHAWSSPPIKPLTHDDHATHPYLIEFPTDIMAAKVGFMTDLLQQQFGVKMVSHRAGRWAFNATYAQLLVEHGYLADCSVTPHVSWRKTMGNPDGQGGPDYNGFPSQPYFLDLDRIDRPGRSTLLEVPPTIIKSKLAVVAPWAYTIRGMRRFARKFEPPISWIYPDGTNLKHMLKCVRTAVIEKRPHIEFVIHSSELMPCGSPRFSSDERIERLYVDLRVLFAEIARNFRGLTLKEFRAWWDVRQDSKIAASQR
jgi:hypothetical protein